jgi:hypothetical protein
MKKLLTRFKKPRLVGWLLVFAIGATTITGCSLFGDIFGGDDDKYVGTVSFGFEEVSFRPCGRTEQWWMTGGEIIAELQTQYNDLGVNQYEPVYARLNGEPSEKGEYGHVGAYQREFEVTRIVEVRLLSDGECTR